MPRITLYAMLAQQREVSVASVSVRREGNIVHAIYAGAMTLDLVREGERRIEDAVSDLEDPLLLYDTLEMDPPPMKLAMEMKTFDQRLRSRVRRSATVVQDSTTAFMAKVAFLFSHNHKVFYDDLQAAYAWLADE